ncbi:hypothetical protein ACFR95_04010 [Halolamina salifodinae]|uniref:DUF7528 family protein n=1 Tax=Halolamina salifodinae TaxID=1202767 RepID=UPI00362EC848
MRIEEVARRRLIEKSVGAEDVGDGVVLSLPDGERRLSRAAATRLRDELTAALAGRRTFVRTVSEHREDGSYVVSRRAADSAGHQKRFRDFRAFERLYQRLPMKFDAAVVGDAAGEGVSGTRRHLLVRHFAEHPAFDCELVAEQPLTAEKRAVRSRPRAETEVAPMD